MRILQIIPVFSAPFGGPVRVVSSISKELAKRHDVTVYTTSALDRGHDFKQSSLEVKLNGYRVVYFPRIFRFSGFNISPTMARALKDNLRRYDVVHLHSWRHFQDIITHHYAKKYGVPYVLQAHGSLPRIMDKQRLKLIYDVSFGYRLLKDASKVIALSPVEADQYRRMGVPEEKIAIIPNGVDLSEYANLPPKGAFKKKLGIPEDRKVILYLGRIHRTKGIDFLIKAYAYAVNKMNFKDAVLVIAGPDDGYLNETKALAHFLGVSEKISFTGLLNEHDKVSAFVDSSLVVSPERFNVFLLVPLEAAACGKPVIVSHTNYISHVIHEGEFGLSVEYGDITELAETMGKLLDNENLQKEMGQKGRKFVSDNFSWNSIVERLEKIYKENGKVRNLKNC
jgi:glycosyltransferase involved in cell wall biosynthesis